MRPLLSVYFLALLILFSACRSQQMYQRIGTLETKLKGLNDSKTYWGDGRVEDIVELREEVIHLLLEEGDYQRKEALSCQNTLKARAEARYNAGVCYISVLKLAGEKYAVTNKEVEHRWPGFEKVFERQSNDSIIAYHLFPMTTPFALSVDLGCFIHDMIIGWKVVEEKRDVPPLSGIYTLKAEMALAELEEMGFKFPDETSKVINSGNNKP